MNKTGILYGVGVGPGDPELLTLKAVRVIRAATVIAAPVSQPCGESYALNIAADLVGPVQTVRRLHFPMTRDMAAREASRRAAAVSIAGDLRAGHNVAFLTEGDPLLHSTFIYVLHHLPDGLPVEVIPGVSSVTAAAAQAVTPLVYADQRLAVLPAVFEDMDDLRRLLSDFDTVVLLKVHRVLDRLLDILDETKRPAVLVERASHAAGRVVRDVQALRGQPVHYLSLLIVRGERDD